jgi:hypothetical protein
MVNYAFVGSFDVGDSATIADLALFDVVDQIRRLDDTVLGRIDVKVKNGPPTVPNFCLIA